MKNTLKLQNRLFDLQNKTNMSFKLNDSYYEKSSEEVLKGNCQHAGV